MIIGLSGYARSGKDEAAVALQQIGFTRVAFADKLREVLYALNPIVAGGYKTIPPIGDPLGPDEPWPVNTLLQDVIDSYGWGGYKETAYGNEIRRLLQRLGTEAGREALWDSIWVDAAFAGLSPETNVVVTDCRFPNEAHAVKERGGEVWRITRPGVGAANSHASETSLDNWNFDVRIENAGDLEDYHQLVVRIAESRLGLWSQ